MTSTKDDQRQRWREYNKSPKGRARFRRYRQSPHGKATLRARYRERVRFLNEIKSKARCQVCKERNPKALSLVPRSGQEVKFAPQLTNVSRSLDDWKEVIGSCDVLCRNCLAKRKRPARSRGRMKGQRPPQIGRRLTVNGCSRPDSGHNLADGYHPTCETCRTEFKPLNRPKLRRRKRFCSDRCRLLSWAARELLKAHQEGRASGLDDMISELVGGKAGP